MSVASLPRLYLLDVEGTVAPLSLVSEQLFPYARRHFESFLKANLDGEGQGHSDGGVPGDVEMLMAENRAEKDGDAPRLASAMAISDRVAFDVPRILEYAYWLMDRDRKSTALKSLQGKIWKKGFESGELKGTLFDDVPDALRRWAATGQVAIYSSGSVEAQNLLFRYSSFGDLTPLIAAFFDTHAGGKAEKESYAGIAHAMRVEADQVLFLSDAVKELDAAREAGCATGLAVRPGNAHTSDTHGHRVVESFREI